jgi:hypothetical protein
VGVNIAAPISPQSNIFNTSLHKEENIFIHRVEIFEVVPCPNIPRNSGGCCGFSSRAEPRTQHWVKGALAWPRSTLKVALDFRGFGAASQQVVDVFSLSAQGAGDGNNSACINSLGLHVQSVVACVFSPQGWLEVLYQTLGELAKIIFFASPLQATYKTKYLPSVHNFTICLSSTRLRISKLN